MDTVSGMVITPDTGVGMRSKRRYGRNNSLGAYRAAMEYFSKRLEQPDRHEWATKRSAYYDISRGLSKDIKPRREWYGSFERAYKNFLDEADLTPEDIKVVPEPWGYLFFDGERREIDLDTASIDYPVHTWLVVEKANPARVLAMAVRDKGIAVISTRGMPTRAQDRLFEKLEREGKPVVVLPDFDLGGLAVAREINKHAPSAKMVDIELFDDVIGGIRSEAIQDTKKWMPMDITHPFVAPRYEQMLAYGKKRGVHIPSAELDSILSVHGSSAFTSAVLRSIERLYPSVDRSVILRHDDVLPEKTKRLADRFLKAVEDYYRPVIKEAVTKASDMSDILVFSRATFGKRVREQVAAVKALPVSLERKIEEVIRELEQLSKVA